jgi:hypothetical protein
MGMSHLTVKVKIIYMYINLFFHIRTVHLDIIKVLLPTDAQENCFKMSVNLLKPTG